MVPIHWTTWWGRQAALEKVRPSVSPADLKDHEALSDLWSSTRDPVGLWENHGKMVV